MTRTDCDVVIIGAGLAGLRAAMTLSEQLDDVLVFDREPEVGGRVRTVEQDGYLLDRGFQVFLDSYPEPHDCLELDELDLQPFLHGCQVKRDGDFHSFVDPFSHPTYFFSTLYNDIGNYEDRWRVVKLRRQLEDKSLRDVFTAEEQTTRAYLEGKEFSDEFIDHFFRPFLSGVFLENDLSTSSRMFEFVFQMFGSGRATLPARGMQAIPDQMARSLPDDWVRLGTEVHGIEQQTVHLNDGTSVRAQAILCATAGWELDRFPDVGGSSRTNGTSCLYFSLEEEPPLDDPILTVNGEDEGLINNLCFPSLVSDTYSPEGKHLLSVSTLELMDEEQLVSGIREELVDWFGNQTRDWTHLRTFQIPDALPRRTFGEHQLKPRHPRVREGLYVAGDHTDTPSLNGAMASGRFAAETLLEDLQP